MNIEFSQNISRRARFAPLPRDWVRLRVRLWHARALELRPVWGTLPIAELLIGLVLVLLSHGIAATANYSFVRSAIMFMLCSLVVAYGFFRNPYAPIYCYAFVTPIFPVFGSGLALILGGIATVLLNRERCNFQWRFSRAGLAFCLWAILSFFWAKRVPLDLDSYIAQVVPAMVLAFVISGIGDTVFRRNLVLMVVAACVIGSIGSLRNWLTGAADFSFGRTYSLIRPDVFSAWELFGLLGALAWLLGQRPPAWLRWLLLLSLPAILLGIGLCGYRAAILGVAVGVILVCTCQKHFFQSLLLLALIAICAVGLCLVQPDMFGVLSRFQTMKEDRGSERLEIWEGGLNLFQERPLVGYGSDNFRFNIKRFYGKEMSPHSIYMETLVELGIIGLGLLLLWMSVLFLKSWRSKDRVLTFPLLVTYFFQGIFLHQFYFSCFWLVLGLAEGSRRLDEPEPFDLEFWVSPACLQSFTGLPEPAPNGVQANGPQQEKASV